MDNARKFLARVLSWSPEEENTYKSIHWMYKAKDGNKYLTGGAVRTIDEMIAMANDAVGNCDVYVALGSQRTADVAAKTANGRPRKYPKPARVRANIATLRTLFLDVDVGKDGAYFDQQEMVRSLQEFCQVSGIPLPNAAVGSGSGGVHLYWIMDRPLTPQDWMPMAQALAHATAKLDFKCDRQCTVDSCRILRLPDTFNFKSGQGRPTQLISLAPDDYSVEVMKHALLPFLNGAHLPIVRPNPNETKTLASAFSAGLENTTPPINLREVAKVCPVFQEAFDTGGAAFDNPLWMLTTLAATFEQDGRATAHEMASGHAEYTVGDTDALYDRKLQDKTEKNLGWPKCATIAHSSKHCATCPHYAANKTPMHHVPGAPSTTPGVTPSAPSDDLPPGYYRVGFGHIHKASGIGDDGNPKTSVVLRYGVEAPWLEEDTEDSFPVLHFTLIMDNGKRTEVGLSSEHTASTQRLLPRLPQIGIYVPNDNEARHAREFFVSWMAKLQVTKGATLESAPFGWSGSGPEEGFTYNSTTFTPSGPKKAAGPVNGMGKQYTPCGTLPPWRAAMKFINDQGRPALDTIVATSFAAPLVRFTGHTGMLLSAYSSESGIGKSTAIKIAQAVWGDPVAGVNALDDTQNSVIGKMGSMNCLPVYWDEVKTSAQIDKFVTLTFQLGQGKGKARMTKDLQQRAVGTWRTMMVVASNDSIANQIAQQTEQTTAGMYRVFEFAVEQAPSRFAASDVSRFVQGLNHNYGRAGAVYAEWLGTNRDQADRIVAAVMKQFEQELVADVSERFWIATAATIYAGAYLANHLQLAAFDLDALKEFLFARFKHMRRLVAGSGADLAVSDNVETILSEFLIHMMAQYTVMTNTAHLGVGRPANGTIKILNAIDKLQRPDVHIVMDHKIVRIAQPALRNWLRERKMPNSIIEDRLKQQFGMIEEHNPSMSGIPGLPVPPGRRRFFTLELDGTTFKRLTSCASSDLSGQT